MTLLTSWVARRVARRVAMIYQAEKELRKVLFVAQK
jgi:hypothetical protein